MEKTVKDLTIWLTYHEDAQIEQYHLKEDDIIRLFRGDSMDTEGENINHLNHFYSEMSTMYWVWKNNHKTTYVGFCHYRRQFSAVIEPDSGECQVLKIQEQQISLLEHYKYAHNYQDYYDIIDILNDKYGEGNKYSDYLLHSKTFIPFCCFIMHWEDFVSLCEFLFPILFAFDDLHGLHMDAERYMAKAEKDFRYDDKKYQCRAMSFLAERLISSYIFCNMKAFCVNTLNQNVAFRNEIN